MSTEMFERLKLSVDQAGGTRKVAEKSGIVERTLAHWLSGQTEPKVMGLAAVAKAIGVSLDWLVDGVSDKVRTTAPAADGGLANLIDIPRYDIALSAGTGTFVDRAERLDSLPFPPEFFIRRLGRKADGMIIVDARGDSMVPTVADRDLVMIDTADHNMTGAIWAFTYEDDVFVKRINVLPDALEIRSDNSRDYPSFIIDGPKLDRLHLIGRVVWVGRTL